MEKHVYIYTEHNEEYSYGEQMVKVFGNLEDAKKHLIKQINDVFEIKIEKVEDLNREEFAKFDPCIGSQYGVGEFVPQVSMMYYDTANFFYIYRKNVE